MEKCYVKVFACALSAFNARHSDTLPMERNIYAKSFTMKIIHNWCAYPILTYIYQYSCVAMCIVYDRLMIAIFSSSSPVLFPCITCYTVFRVQWVEAIQVHRHAVELIMFRICHTYVHISHQQQAAPCVVEK